MTTLSKEEEKEFDQFCHENGGQVLWTSSSSNKLKGNLHSFIENLLSKREEELKAEIRKWALNHNGERINYREENGGMDFIKKYDLIKFLSPNEGK